jgi:hypothetical protein
MLQQLFVVVVFCLNKQTAARTSVHGHLHISQLHPLPLKCLLLSSVTTLHREKSFFISKISKMFDFFQSTNLSSILSIDVNFDISSSFNPHEMLDLLGDRKAMLKVEKLRQQ